MIRNMTARRTHGASFHHDDELTAAAPNGALAHRDLIAHGRQFERRLCRVGEHVWCMVGNGLSNQTFVRGPGGLIAIDTGECIEEMQFSLDAMRAEVDAPVVAVVYTHFHYVGGTQAIAGAGAGVPIWAHERVVANRRRTSSEVGPIARFGLVHQFGLTLPAEGPDALVNVGLGSSFRNTEHAPFTEGFVEPTDTFDTATTATIAGLQVEFTPAPSDADDSITIWFPELDTCVNNIMWPVLFNVFAIRGEEYRDPRVLLTGLDHVLELGAEHLVGTHGPPLSGAEHIADEVTRSRDAIQFLWDQTVRSINKGLTLGEMTEAVQLPDWSDESSLQTQFYGLAEHHVRQIHAGLRGWFDGDEAALFPVPPADRARKSIAGFGGPDAVRSHIESALADGDVRWALDLASWLVTAANAISHDGDGEEAADFADRVALADILRLIARRTTSANVRNWCLTRARHIDGSASTDRFLNHRFDREAIVASPLADSLAVLRVTLDPERCGDADRHLGLHIFDGDPDGTGLHVRHRVAVPTDGRGADLAVSLTKETWADLLTRDVTLATAIAGGRVTGDIDEASEMLSWFEHPSFER
jgi:alkyl sulfatase BDS1-like metallo-beta-lactamase superfamily hydrolase